MGLRYEDLEEMCETLGDKVSEANDKIRGANGDLTGGDTTYIDTVLHALKSIKTIMAMMEAEGGYSRDDMGGSYSEYYDGNTRARGRYGNVRRDSMGRYSRNYRNYSRETGDFLEELKGLMGMAPDEKTRQDIKRMVDKLEG